MAMISIRLNERDASLIRNYAKLNGISLSDLVRDTVITKIEDEIDLKSFNQLAKSTKTSYTMEELEKRLGARNV